MPNEEFIREIASRAWNEALREKSHELAGDVARRMGAALASQMPQALASPSPQRERSRELRDGAVQISASKTQFEVLEALLTASSALTPSCGLLVLRGTQAGGWNCIGLTAVDNFKRSILDCSSGVAAEVLSSCSVRAARASELDMAFTSRVGLDRAAEVLLLPVLLKERVAALLLAVSGSSDDRAGLEVLVQVAQLALELQAFRKAAPAAQPSAAAPRPAEPERSAASAVPQPVPQPEPVYASASATGPSYAGFASSPAAVAAAAAVAAPTASEAAPALDETHDRARRFAKLLVEEIRLYNQAKVAEGRNHCDLYSRLREDIEKSRAAYQKRYAESVKDVDYFTQELIRILADNNRAVLGAEFPG